MLKKWLPVLMMVCSYGAVAHERVSFHNLVVSPQMYENKELQLTGYFVSDGADCLVIADDKETAFMYREYEMVKFCSDDLDERINIELFEVLENNYGSIAGVFSVKQCGKDLELGSTLRYLGCFEQVTHLFGPIYKNGPRMPPPPIN